MSFRAKWQQKKRKEGQAAGVANGTTIAEYDEDSYWHLVMFVQWTTAISDIFAYHGPWSMHCIVRLYLHHFHVSQRVSEFYVWSSSPTMADIKKSNGIPLEMASKFPGHIVHRSQQHRPFTASSHINNNDVHCHRWRVLIFCCCAQLQTPNNRHHPQLRDWTEQNKKYEKFGKCLTRQDNVP